MDYKDRLITYAENLVNDTMELMEFNQLYEDKEKYSLDNARGDIRSRDAVQKLVGVLRCLDDLGIIDEHLELQLHLNTFSMMNANSEEDLAQKFFRGISQK